MKHPMIARIVSIETDKNKSDDTMLVVEAQFVYLTREPEKFRVGDLVYQGEDAYAHHASELKRDSAVSLNALTPFGGLK